MLIVAQTGFCSLPGLYAGAMPATLAELFPTRVRATATSITYNAAFTIFAGFAPAIITYLMVSGFGAQAPTLYVAAAAIAALLALHNFPEKGTVEAAVMGWPTKPLSAQELSD